MWKNKSLQEAQGCSQIAEADSVILIIEGEVLTFIAYEFQVALSICILSPVSGRYIEMS